jgi:hypothetical protein
MTMTDRWKGETQSDRLDLNSYEDNEYPSNFWLINHGTLVGLIPRTQSAKDWIDAHISDSQWLGPQLMIESRYLAALLKGLLDDGLTVIEL